MTSQSHELNIYNLEHANYLPPVVLDAIYTFRKMLYDGSPERMQARQPRYSLASSHIPDKTPQKFLIHKTHTINELCYRIVENQPANRTKVVFIGTEEDLAKMQIVASDWDKNQGFIKLRSPEGERRITIRDGQASFDIVNERTDMRGIETPEVVIRTNHGTELPDNTPVPADFVIICVGFRTLDPVNQKSIGTINVVNDGTIS
jgi:hypothetical protein